MQTAQPSRTAMRVAIRRAAHQVLDSPRVLDDPLAIRIIGPDAAALAASPDRQQGRVGRAIRAFVAVRSRFAEDELARGLDRGVTQYVVLGAGLETFAFRRPPSAAALKVFEVDYPATQAWKRQRLDAAGIDVPSTVTFAPVDFERQTLADGLAQAGFDRQVPAFFSWLGVTMYLTEDAIAPTLTFIASTPPGGGLVFDYAVPRASLRLMSRLALDALARRVAAAGEPFRTFFDPGELGARLARMGFRAIQDLGPDEINARYFRGRADGLRVGSHLGRLMSVEV